MFRSVYHPICLGLGTAAVFAVGASAPVWAGTTPSPPSSGQTPTPSVSASPSVTPSPSGGSSGSPGPSPTASSPAPVPWGMAVEIRLPEGKVFEGDEVTVTVEVTAEKATPRTRLTLTAGGRPVPTLSRCVDAPCRLGEVDWRGKKLDIRLTIPKEIESGSVRLTAAASGEGAEDAAQEKTIEVHKKLDPSPSPSPSKSGGGSGGSGGSSGSGGGTTYTPPSPNGSFGNSSGAPQVDLPQVSPPSPELAPGASTQVFPQSALRSNDSPAGQELAFERLAGTQAAWLSVLLVAFSLLLTQLRLGRRRPAAPGAAPAKPARGAHRRPRRGRSEG